MLTHIDSSNSKEQCNISRTHKHIYKMVARNQMVAQQYTDRRFDSDKKRC